MKPAPLDTSPQIYLRTGQIIFAVEPIEVKTVLGSCVSVCLMDKSLGHTSICHFKAPAWNPLKAPSPIFGDIAIDRQIEGMVGLGSSRDDLRAYVIGGGNVINIPGDIGIHNVRAAMGILKREGIKVAYHDTGGFMGRNLVFNTAEGSIRIRKFQTFPAKEPYRSGRKH